MIQDLDKTLEELLKRELLSVAVEPASSEVTITFNAPDKEFAITPPAISLFLYDIRENRDLRTAEWSVERRSDGSLVKQRPPTRVDCSYLITAWASGTDNFHDEHYLLGEVMKVLLRFPIIPLNLLQGALRGGQGEEQRVPLPTTSLQPGRLQSLGEFWQALGGKPKAALNFTVTISVASDVPVAVGAPVTQIGSLKVAGSNG